MLDGGVVKCQANTVNARGQVTAATLGNGIAVNNTYDVFGYVTQNQHLLGTTNVMTLNNVFEPKLGNLTNRYNSMFDVNENFSYDALDRLTTWDATGANLLNLPFNTTTDGFTLTGGTTAGSVSNSSGKLKVILKSGAANKPLTITATTSNKFRVTADVSGKIGTAGVIVNVVMVETDPLYPAYNTEIPFGTIENGVLNAVYTVSDFLPNPKLTLRFKVDESSPAGSNGGGIVQPNATFYIDNLKINKIDINTQNYDDRGRITQNNLGQYQYQKPGKPYQNSSVFTSAEADAYYNTRPLQNISYNAFKAPIQIEEQGVDKISFGYNAMQQRSVMYYGNTNTDKLTRPYRKYYSADGSMEVKATFAPGNTTTPIAVEIMTYVAGTAYSASMVVKSDGTTQNYFYLHRDYQGSIMAITNEVGGVVEKRIFDPWGAVAKVQDGAGNNLTKLTFFDRGYTGHEHSQSVGLINMNARLYDPKLHRFLQPDALIQDPYNTQNYNRYGYCVNNPLKYTDISGNELVSAILIGAGIAIAAYFTVTLLNHQPITLPGLLTAAVTGAVSGAVTFGIGSAFENVACFGLKATYSALAHGVFQGTLSGVQGGSFWSAFASAALSSLAASAFSGGMDTKLDSNGVRVGTPGTGWAGAGKYATSKVGMIAFGTIAGGAGAALTGSNFWMGAVTGLVVSGLNHALHDNPNRKLIRKLNREIDKAYGSRADSEYGPPRFNGGATDADVDTALNMDTIKTIRGNSGNPNVVNMHADNEADGTYKSDAEDSIGAGLKAAQPGQGGTIRLYGGAFSSPRHLAHTILHELGHAYSRFHGVFLSSYNSRGWNGAVAMDEVYAFSWGSVFGQTMFIAPGVFQKGLGSAVRKLGIKY